MNRALPEMLQFSDMTVLERQRARSKWQEEQFQQQQQQQSYFTELSGVFSSQISHLQGFQGGDSVMTRQVKPDPGLEIAWPELGKADMVAAMGFSSCGYGNGPNFDINHAISRTASCPPTVAAAETAAKAVEVKGNSKKICQAVGRESFNKKRKVEKLQTSKGFVRDDSKRINPCEEEEEEEEEESKITVQNTNKSSKNKTEVQKPDYIHVRARRGQATDSHSLAERVRREKISERMKYLQDLVPGCNRITGKAGMLDEIINYVQSLQRQVEFLSMKLATVNPRLDFNIDNLYAKELFVSCTTNFPSELANPPCNLQFNPLQQLEMGVNSSDMALRRTISAPVSIPNPSSFLDSSCFSAMQQIQPSTATWDVELQNLYNVAFTGSIEANDLKMEM